MGKHKIKKKVLKKEKKNADVPKNMEDMINLKTNILTQFQTVWISSV